MFKPKPFLKKSQSKMILKECKTPFETYGIKSQVVITKGCQRKALKTSRHASAKIHKPVKTKTIKLRFNRDELKEEKVHASPSPE
mmetsp:Transcript_4253/g.4002  ORF Transcript_4253/g.4002 Transcript_4253/m.4002 type:complete len:85 (+) Transcript_4253:232-486(+)